MRVDIKVCSGKLGESCNPLVCVHIDGQSKRTSAASCTAAPKWQELLEFRDVDVANLGSAKIEVRDLDLGDETVIAEGTVQLAGLTPGQPDSRSVKIGSVELQLRVCAHGGDVLAEGGSGAAPAGPRMSDGMDLSASSGSFGGGAAGRERTGLDGLSEEQIAKIRIAFEMWDADDSGELDKNECTAALLHYFPGASATDIVREIARLDVNADGVLSLEEFATVARKFEL